MYEISVESSFCAAHALRGVDGLPFEPLHGHNFKVVVTVCAKKLLPGGMGVDFLELKAAMDEVLAAFHNKNLNEDVPVFATNGERQSPSAELIAKVIFDGIASRMNFPEGAWLKSVLAGESPGCQAVYYAD